MTKKGTLKYRKVERTPQVGEDAGKKKCRIEAIDSYTGADSADGGNTDKPSQGGGSSTPSGGGSQGGGGTPSEGGGDAE